MSNNKSAFASGLALSELLALFVYFLNETPEGKKVGVELEKDWATTCESLREQGVIKGNPMTCSAWLASVRKSLTIDKKKKTTSDKAKAKLVKVQEQKQFHVKTTGNKKQLRFRGV